MAISYTVSKVATTFVVNYKASGPVGVTFTYVQRLAFMGFDLSSSGITLGQVDFAELILRCVATVGGGNTLIVTSASDPNGFGATLSASNADWASTVINSEGTVDVFATGQYIIPVNKANIDFSGVTYYRLMNFNEGDGAPYQTGATFNSVTATSNKPILRLTLFSGQIIYINVQYS